MQSRTEKKFSFSPCAKTSFSFCTKAVSNLLTSAFGSIFDATTFCIHFELVPSTITASPYMTILTFWPVVPITYNDAGRQTCTCCTVASEFFGEKFREQSAQSGHLAPLQCCEQIFFSTKMTADASSHNFKGNAAKKPPNPL